MENRSWYHQFLSKKSILVFLILPHFGITKFYQHINVAWKYALKIVFSSLTRFKKKIIPITSDHVKLFRSRTPPFDDGFRGDRGADRGAGSGPPRRQSSPVHIDLDQHCVFCSKAEMESKSIMENHVRQRHLEMAFICRLCETGNIHYEPDLPSIKDHLKEDHSKDDLDNEDVKDYTRYPRLVQNFYTATI